MVTLYLGGIRPLPPENQPTGIFKREHPLPVWLGGEGLAGDAQADRRVHGGPEKALHQYPVGHYARLAQAFPEASPLLVRGSIGENLSVDGWDEGRVCIGDIFRLGDAHIQVSQPRSPCWKIDRRYGQEGMAQLIAAEGLVGWYYRVLEEGAVEPGCVFERVESGGVTLARFWRLWQSHRPDAAELQAVAATPGLAPNWVKKFADRIEWLGRSAP
ncbi:MAG: MOSC domain-containing protein [Rhodocyclaceae bacterium]|nr:MOSC domain-containing protein [Rhodocyclaceae bacterium]